MPSFSVESSGVGWEEEVGISEAAGVTGWNCNSDRRSTVGSEMLDTSASFTTPLRPHRSCIDDTPAKMTFYRAKTRGDKRISITKLKKYAKAGDNVTLINTDNGERIKILINVKVGK